MRLSTAALPASTNSISADCEGLADARQWRADQGTGAAGICANRAERPRERPRILQTRGQNLKWIGIPL